MLKIVIDITNIDYSKASEQIIPIVLDKLNNGNSKPIDILTKRKKSSAIAASTLLKVVPKNKKDELAISLFEKYEEKLLVTFNEMLKKKGMPLKALSINASKDENIKIALVFKEIDYPAFFKVAFPLIKDSLMRNEKISKIVSLLENSAGYLDEMIQVMLQILPLEMRDNFVSTIISVFEAEIHGVINRQISEYELPLTFVGIKTCVI